MALELSTQFLAAYELQRLFRSLFEDIRRRIKNYALFKNDGNESEAIIHLRIAIAKADSLNDRFQEWVNTNSVSEFTDLLTVINSNMTLQAFQDEITSMVDFCDNLKSQINSETMTYDEAALQLWNKYASILPKITFPNSEGYTDIWNR
jgi:hypothetical protein